MTNAPRRMTPLELKQRVLETRPLQRGQFKSAIKRLVLQKALVYTYQFGNSFLELSFEKPVRIADAMILKPPACNYQALPQDVVINIKAGAAFGTGVHPTTRLSLQALEKVCKDNPYCINSENRQVLDIGTGSGVLAIAAIKLGFDKGIGLDIDPCARVEALENIKLNGLVGSLDISSRSIETLVNKYFIVIANLRLPTLKSYFERMTALTATGGFLVVSGIKVNEIQQLKVISEENRMAVYWEGIEKEWAGLVLSRP
ncbi:MAG: 50S ribosomal protein L11 methyltransferase [Deltaproteobacteria bacterium]|nr:50S ribosomal protein L11 methyltransferase [Deltaproteobacteria bacterium]